MHIFAQYWQELLQFESEVESTRSLSQNNFPTSPLAEKRTKDMKTSYPWFIIEACDKDTLVQPITADNSERKEIGKYEYLMCTFQLGTREDKL